MATLEEVEKIRRAVEPDLLKIPGVTGVHVGYKTVQGKKTDVLAIIIHVAEKKDVSGQGAIPKEIQGVPTDVIQRRYAPHSGAGREPS